MRRVGEWAEVVGGGWGSAPRPIASAGINVLFVCTANINRSPMAAALFGAHSTRVTDVVRLASAAVMDRPDHPASEHAVAVLRARGLDLSAHRSRTLTGDLVGLAHLVVTMERAHLRAAAVLAPNALERTFTLKELVRRGLVVGPRPADTPLQEWLTQLHGERDLAELLGEDPADDVEDPVGGTRADFERCAAELDLLTRGAVYLLFGGAA